MAEKIHVVQAHPSHDTKVHGNLTAAGWEAHLFVTKEERRTKKGRIFIPVYCFPTYVFVKFDVEDIHWRSIASVRGVKQIMGSDPLRPWAMPDGALEELQQRFSAGEFAKKVPQPIGKGEKIIVRSGPFVGKVGLCDVNHNERIEAMLTMLGGERRITLPAHIVERAMA